MAGNGRQKRTQKPAVREQAILALLSERRLEDAAERAGVGVRTLRRWLTEDASFRADYEVARRALYTANMNRIQALQTRAVETLEDLMGASVSPAVRLGAARTVVDIAVHQHDAETILRRLDEIEALQRKER